MLALILLAVHLALLAATSGTELERENEIMWKCCDVNQMLSEDGKLCVDANWPRNFSIQRDADGDVISPLDSDWLRRWLPPGFPLHVIGAVFCNRNALIKNGVISSVNATSLSNQPLLQNESFSEDIALFQGHDYIVTLRQEVGYSDPYCMDAALPPLGPFAVWHRTPCSKKECTYKCCEEGRLLKSKGSKWTCEFDDKSHRVIRKITLNIRQPTALLFVMYCNRQSLSPLEKRHVNLSPHAGDTKELYFSSAHTCLDFTRGGNGRLGEGTFYCEFSRVTRGVYWLLRPLCVLSALLLLASLVTVGCVKSMQRRMHGRCLANHAACLFVFNIGQIAYYIAISDRLDERGKEDTPPDLKNVCKYFALSMYFVLTAAWFWLTALCANMATGFKLRTARCNEGGGKVFLMISAVAWGIPALLTITCSILFTQSEGTTTPPWYTPTLLETRLCYIEPLTSSDNFKASRFIKSGTALFYYGPVCCLVICNTVCLALTFRKVQYLKRGNSVLRREDQIPQGQRHMEGNNIAATHIATGNGQARGDRNRSGTRVDAKTMKLYIKMILMTGGIELLSEVIMWSVTHNNFNIQVLFSIKLRQGDPVYTHYDTDLAYRAAGYVTDFFRAVIVTWLAAPEGGYLALIKRGLRRVTGIGRLALGDILRSPALFACRPRTSWRSTCSKDATTTTCGPPGKHAWTSRCSETRPCETPSFTARNRELPEASIG